MKNSTKILTLLICLSTNIIEAQWVQSQKIKPTSFINGMSFCKDSLFAFETSTNNITAYDMNLKKGDSITIKTGITEIRSICSARDSLFILADSSTYTNEYLQVYSYCHGKFTHIKSMEITNTDVAYGTIEGSAVYGDSLYLTTVYSSYYYTTSVSLYAGQYKVIPTSSLNIGYGQITTDNSFWYAAGIVKTTAADFIYQDGSKYTPAKDISSITYGGGNIIYSAGDSIMANSSLLLLSDTLIYYLASTPSGDTIYAEQRNKSGTTDSLFYIYQNPTGIVDINNSQPSFSFFPNPFDYHFQLNLSRESNVSIYNELGETIYHSKLPVGKNQIQIGGCSGIYLLSVNGVFEKLIKE